MKKKAKTYTEAMQRLQGIVDQIDHGELAIDQLAEKMKEANELIAYCRSVLGEVEDEVGKITEQTPFGE